jgi:hypothetical protein
VELLEATMAQDDRGTKDIQRSLSILSQKGWRDRLPILLRADIVPGERGVGLHLINIEYLALDPVGGLVVVRADGKVRGRVRLDQVNTYASYAPPDFTPKDAVTFRATSRVPLYVRSDDGTFPIEVWKANEGVEVIESAETIDVDSLTVQIVWPDATATGDLPVIAEDEAELAGADAEAYFAACRHEWREWCSTTPSLTAKQRALCLKRGLDRINVHAKRVDTAFWQPCMVHAGWLTNAPDAQQQFEALWLDVGSFVDTLIVRAGDQNYRYPMSRKPQGVGRILRRTQREVTCDDGVVEISLASGSQTRQPCIPDLADAPEWSIGLDSSVDRVRATKECPLRPSGADAP